MKIETVRLIKEKGFAYTNEFDLLVNEKALELKDQGNKIVDIQTIHYKFESIATIVYKETLWGRIFSL